MGIVDIELELRVRRLRWLQAVSREPENHVQFLAALFGTARCDKHSTVDALGRLTENANPWARRALSDV
eukprot:5792283-Lingulodinium_polyedra.AAC.1